MNNWSSYSVIMFVKYLFDNPNNKIIAETLKIETIKLQTDT